jgi:hypothetical protein
MIEDMTIRNLPPATPQSYVHAVAKVQPVLWLLTRPLSGGIT